VLVIRQAKECVEKSFISDSYSYTECYFWSSYIKIVFDLCKYHRSELFAEQFCTSSSSITCCITCKNKLTSELSDVKTSNI